MTGTGRFRRVLLGSAVAVLAVAPALVAAAPAQAPPEWNVAMVGGPAAGSGVTIAIVDSGVYADHYAFGGPDATRVLPGADFVDDDSNPQDDNGHGTHVAGIAAGASFACQGVPTAVGVAPEANILPVRVLGADGDGTMADVIAGIDWAVAQGADVINLSLGEAPSLLGLGGDAGPFLDALSRAWAAGSIPVLAAGNSGGLLDQILFPQGYGNVDAVVVTAVDSSNRLPGYAVSASSARWGVAAPGGSASKPILSSLDRQQCGAMAGTSMAAPHVSGALAVLRSRGLSPADAVDRLLSTAAASASGTGAGLVDLDAALVGLDDPSTSSSTTTASTTSTTAATTTTTASSTTAAPASTETTTSVPDTEPTTTETDAPTTEPVDEQEVAGVSVDGGDDDIPGGLAVAAAAAVALAWFGWLGVLRRRFV